MKLLLGDFPIRDIQLNRLVIELSRQPEMMLNLVIPFEHNHEIGDLISLFVEINPKLAKLDTEGRIQ